jgi:hypothetical protein
MIHRPKLIVCALFLASALPMAGGCGGSSGPSHAETGFRQIATQYGQFISKNKGRSPASEQELKQFIKSNTAVTVGDVDKLFVSSRDNQPIVIRYKVATGMAPGGQAPVIAHEQTGVGGKRLVAFSTTQVEEVDEARFNQLVPQGK